MKKYKYVELKNNRNVYMFTYNKLKVKFNILIE